MPISNKLSKDIKATITLAGKINILFNKEPKEPATIRLATLEIITSKILDEELEPGIAVRAIKIHKEVRKRAIIW